MGRRDRGHSQGYGGDGVSKYHAKRTVYNGVRYDSKREAQYAATLDQLMRAKGPERVAHWIPQSPWPLVVNGVQVGKLVLDFEVYYADGRWALHEVKGVETPLYKFKMKCFQALYPNHKVVIIK